MKRNLILILCLTMMSVITFAQEKKDTVLTIGKTTEEAFDDNIEEIKQDLSKLDSRDRLIFEVAYNGWLNKPDSLTTRWYNRGFNAYLMYDVALYDDNISIAPGVGISSSNVYSRSKLMFGDTVNYFVPINLDTISVSRNKISTTFIDVPIELRFRSNPNKLNQRFKVALGVRIGYMIDSHIKYKGQPLEAGDSRTEVFYKDKRIPDINKFRYGMSLRVGYGNFNVFGFYGISTLFQSDKGPGVRPFSIGVSFNSF